MEEPLLVEESFIFDDNNKTSHVTNADQSTAETAYSV